MNASNEDKVIMSSEELIGRSSSWSLACDSILLNKLKMLSKDLEKQSKEIGRDCQGLSEQVSVVQTKLHNATNQFLMLSNNQFVENRVQDYEVGESRMDSRMDALQKSKNEKEADLIQKMKEAIQIGLTVHSTRVEALNREQKKLALPHLIGSSKYYSSRYVGLVEDEFRNMAATFRSINVQDVSLLADENILQNNLEFGISNPSNVLADTEYSSQGSNFESIVSPLKCSQQSVIPTPNLVRSTSVREIGEAHYENCIDIFGEQHPPPLNEASDESDDDFQPGGRLFNDDDDDESDIFKENIFFQRKPHNPFSPVHSSQQKYIGSNSPPPINTSTLNVKNSGITTERPRLIGRDPFVEKESTAVDRVEENETDEKLQQTTISPTSKAKIPPGGVSVFGTVPPIEIPKLRNQQKHIPPKSVVEPQETEPPGNTSKKVFMPEQSSSVGTSGSQEYLNENFAHPPRINHKTALNDQNNEDQFSTSKLLSLEAKSSSAVFGDNAHKGPVQHEFVKKSSSKLKIKNSIFVDTDSDDDFFSSASSSSSKNNYSQRPLQFPTKSESNQVGLQKSAGGLFDDDSDTDLFSTDANTLSQILNPTHMNASSKTSTALIKSQSTSTDTAISSFDERESTSVEQKMDVNEVNTDKHGSTILPDENEGLSNNEVNNSTQKTSKKLEKVHETEQFIITDQENLKCSVDVEVKEEDKTATAVDISPFGHSEPKDTSLDNQTDRTIIKNSDFELPNNSASSISISNDTEESAKMLVPQTKVLKQQDKISSEKRDISKNMTPDRGSTTKFSKIQDKLAASEQKSPEKRTNIPERMNAKVDVKKLARGLNINPLAMMPGAKPVKQLSMEQASPESPSTSDPISQVSPIATPNNSNQTFLLDVSDEKPDNLVFAEPKLDSTSKLIKNDIYISEEEPDTCQHLDNLVKGRARIQHKRKPPSKKLLHLYNQPSSTSLNLNDAIVPFKEVPDLDASSIATSQDPKEEIATESKCSIFKDSLQHHDVDFASASKDKRSDKSVSIFDDNEDDLFTSSELRSSNAHLGDPVKKNHDKIEKEKTKTFPLEKTEKPALFSDIDDESDDDIFKDAAPAQKRMDSLLKSEGEAPLQKPVLPAERKNRDKLLKDQKSLFGSDSDSDDLFKSESKKNVQVADAKTESGSKSKKPGTTTGKMESTKKSLFSDSSDEDLFLNK